MSNPIRRTIRTVGAPSSASLGNSALEAKVEPSRIDDDLLRKELENYLHELPTTIDSTPAQQAEASSVDQIEHEIRVEIPSIDSPLHCRSVISDLEAAFIQTPPHSRWIVDLCGLEVLPLLLIGALERYQQELSEHGGVVRLEISDANSYPDQILTRLASSFELRYIDHAISVQPEDRSELVDIDSIVERVLDEDEH